MPPPLTEIGLSTKQFIISLLSEARNKRSAKSAQSSIKVRALLPANTQE